MVFTKTPLKSQFRYLDKFQILPIDSKNAPSSPYNKHFPLFLEYCIDFDENRCISDIDIFVDMSAQQVMEFEIMNVLSVLSNHRFFKYHAFDNKWAVMSPSVDFQKLQTEQEALFDNQYSHWTISGYFYPGLKEDLEIDCFTDIKFSSTPIISPYYYYFSKDPVESNDNEITFPETIFSSLDNYYLLSSKTLRKIKSTIALICDGIDISDSKRSLSFLSFVSAIEALISIEFSDKEIEFECNSCKTIVKSNYLCPDCGKPTWGIKVKFKEFLKKFVAGGEKTISVYNKIYNLRCKITHQGQLFIGDFEFSFDNLDKKESDYLMRLKTLQLARISLTNWLRYENKAIR